MGISLVRFEHPDLGERWGMPIGGEIAVLDETFPSHREVMHAYFGDPDNFYLATSATVTSEECRLLAPVTQDVQIFCQGLNYASHREEGGVSTAKGQNLIFSKPPSSICGPTDDIMRPAGCKLLDYEIELALIMKADLTTASEVTDENLLEFVGGITIANDVSARDFMFGAPMLQWFKGKGHRTFCPTGPVLYLMDSADRSLLHKLHLTLKLNGEVRQEATTDQLIFKPAETLNEIASFADLKCGDMLLTGTPGGVILNATPKVGLAILLNFTNDTRRRDKLVKSQRNVRYLEPGDQLALAITSSDGKLSLGTQNNTIRELPLN